MSNGSSHAFSWKWGRLAAALVLLVQVAALPGTLEARARNHAYRRIRTTIYDRDFQRTFNFTAGTLASQTIRDVDYTIYQLNLEHFWRIDKNWSLFIDIPVAWYHTDGFQNLAGTLSSFAASEGGIRDIFITPAYRIRDPEAPGGGDYLSATFRLNVGDKSLTPEQQQILNFVQEGGLSSLYTTYQIGGQIMSLFSTGFGFSIDHNWSWNLNHPGKFLDFNAAYTFNGRYDPVTDIPTEIRPSDRGDLQVVYRHRQSRRRQTTAGVRTRLYTDTHVTNPRADSLVGPLPTGAKFVPGTVPDLSHDMDFDLIFELNTIHSKRLGSSFQATYTLPGDLDLLSSDAQVVRDVAPGDALYMSYSLTQKTRDRTLLTYGLRAGHTGLAHVAAKPAENTERDLLAVIFGAGKSSRNGHSISSLFDFGLTDDTPNIRGNLTYQFSW